jgi:DNA-binding transcriptional LysR family regulator
MSKRAAEAMSEDHLPPSWAGTDLRDVRVFLVLARELHFGRTAEHLHLTTSYVSQTIRTLEARIGGKLFDRTSRNVRLTPLGERLRGNLAAPYAQLEHGLADARETAMGIVGTLRLGMYLPINGGRHMAEIMAAYRSRHPGADVEVVNTGLERDDLDVMRFGEVDVVATRLPASAPDVTVGPILSREDRVLLVSKHDPLASRASVCLEDIADRLVPDTPPFRREMVDELIPPRTPSGRRLRRTKTRSVEDLLMRVASGELVHPTVATTVAYYGHPEITWVPMSDLLPSETALVWLTAGGSAKVRAFAHAAAEVLAKTELAPYQR